MKLKPTSLLLAILLFGLMLLPYWYTTRQDNLNLGEIIIGTYHSSWNTLWHYESNIMFFWIIVLSIFTIMSFLNFFGVKLGWAFLFGIIFTFTLMFGLSFFAEPTQIINNVGNYTK